MHTGQYDQGISSCEAPSSQEDVQVCVTLTKTYPGQRFKKKKRKRKKTFDVVTSAHAGLCPQNDPLLGPELAEAKTLSHGPLFNYCLEQE